MPDRKKLYNLSGKKIKKGKKMSVLYITKKEIIPSLFVHWLALIIRAKKYKETNRESFQTMLCIHGSSGIGKTALMKQFAREHEKIFGDHFKGGILKINIPAMASEDFEIPFADVSKGKIEFLSPIRIPDAPVIIQADEINRYQSIDSINAFTRIFLDNDGSKKIPDGSLIIACANSPSYAGAKRFPDHLISRSVHIYVSENNEEARINNKNYLLSQGFDDYIIECFRLSPTESKDDFQEIAEYNMRSYEFAAYLCKAYDELKKFEELNLNDYILRALISGAIGTSMANKLLKIRNMKLLPSLGEIINNPNKAIIPDINLDPALRQKYCDKLIDECDTIYKAEKLLIYFNRLEGEYSRFCKESLIQKFPKLGNI